jgi:LacI family transcriptional regulator
MPQLIDRFRYKKALEDNNIPYDSSLVVPVWQQHDFEDGYNAQK